MEVFVTGGAGFIGSAVCRLLVGELGVSVLNVDKLTYAANLASLRATEASSRYAFHQADICDRETISELLRKFDPDAVIHLAAESHVDRSIDAPRSSSRLTWKVPTPCSRRRSFIGPGFRRSGRLSFAFT